ncbi:hypothetical protein T10_3043 [Trichinella papuae]|uniref:Uncharacterized protein n=1 Tax=Trichinella papuae TaxID=268474 RepID=A0A0V1M3B7_9BILA|nr:hypothetical protein T10_3043 [Trichinella papuae]
MCFTEGLPDIKVKDLSDQKRCVIKCAELETFYQLTPNQCGGCNASVVLHHLSVALQAVLQQSNQQQHCIEKFEY